MSLEKNWLTFGMKLFPPEKSMYVKFIANKWTVWQIVKLDSRKLIILGHNNSNLIIDMCLICKPGERGTKYSDYK